jgi:LmbE family N-acetylglucosaminyl deacetylase
MQSFWIPDVFSLLPLPPRREVRALPPVLPDSTFVVAAHPDDEVIGAGGQLAGFGSGTLVHVTDGAPLRPPYPAGFTDREAYRQTRARELEAVLEVAGVPALRRYSLGVRDQEASLHMPELARSLAALMRNSRTSLVLTHPYEGGHPDHDATAFAVHAALDLLRRQGYRPPPLAEFTSYHAGPQGICAQAFLPASTPVTTVALDAVGCARKAAMFACYASQAEVLRDFAIGVERFRPAPAYDFTRPPHAGALFYERFDWKMEPARWRGLARAALRDLGTAH